MNDLDSFLQGQAQGGQSLGTSAFSLNALKAREKLSRFALPEPGLWIVKLVQSAVAAGAEEIRVTFLRQKVEIEFTNTCQWEAEDILAYISGAELPTDRGLAHLVFGLSVSAFGPEEQIAWSCGRHQIKLTEDGVEKSPNPHPAQIKITVTRAKKRYTLGQRLNFPVRHLMKQTAYEYKALIDRCIQCPIPLKIDGYEMVRSYALSAGSLRAKSSYVSDGYDGRQMLLAVRPLSLGHHSPQLKYPIPHREWSGDQAYSDDGETFNVQLWKAQESPINAVCCIYSVMQRDSTLRHVLDGAMLEQTELFPYEQMSPFAAELKRALEDGKDNFALLVYLESSLSHLDLSQFQVRQVDLEGIQRALLEPLLECLRTLREACHRPWENVTTKAPDPVHSSEKWSVAGMGAMALVGMFTPHLLLLSAVGALAYPVVRLAKPAIDRSRAKTLSARLDGVIEALEKLAQDEGLET